MSEDHSPQFAPPPEVYAIMAELFGVQDMRELDLFRKLKIASHLLGHLIQHYHHGDRLSPARMRLLIWLKVDTELGREMGLSPSELSHFLGVSRNTTSALLNGLEEQGLIERQLHPIDRRQFLIRITQAGDELVDRRAPDFAAFVVELFAPLSPEERTTLMVLLDKLLEGLVDKANEMGLHAPGKTQPQKSK
jgi:DNA-binding MarR family transcriptional regulator